MNVKSFLGQTLLTAGYVVICRLFFFKIIFFKIFFQEHYQNTSNGLDPDKERLSALSDAGSKMFAKVISRVKDYGKALFGAYNFLMQQLR